MIQHCPRFNSHWIKLKQALRQANIKDIDINHLIHIINFSIIEAAMTGHAWGGGWWEALPPKTLGNHYLHLSMHSEMELKLRITECTLTVSNTLWTTRHYHSFLQIISCTEDCDFLSSHSLNLNNNVRGANEPIKRIRITLLHSTLVYQYHKD